ncbi:hypothetical protein B0H11DRAFT_2280231 [Mycena galericulata]|nr:hypothetical protein B0H11DRAFT_2280231 [Mycena galericulata]
MAPRYNINTKASQLVSDFADNIKGKVILVTGTAPGGIGAAYCAAVAKGSPSLIILHGRSAESIQATADAVKAANPAVQTRLLPFDLASFENVRQGAALVNSWDDVPHIDVLVNNAGIMGGPYAKTVDGIERHFATNHLGHFLFTNLIMPKILASKTPRVVIISSNGHRLHPIRFMDHNFSEGKVYNKWFAYGQSKTANNLMAISLAQKLRKKGLQAFSLHPGGYQSNIGRDLDWSTDIASLMETDAVLGTVYPPNYTFPNHDADTIIATHVLCSFSDDLQGHNGAYFTDCHAADPYAKVGGFMPEVWSWGTDPIEADKLWTLSEELVGQEFKY